MMALRIAALLTSLSLAVPALAGDPELTPAQREKLIEEGKKLNQEGQQLYQRGQLREAADRMERLLAITRQIFPASSHPGGHPEVAFNLNVLGMLYLSQGDYDKSRERYEEALAIRRHVYRVDKYPDGHPELAGTLNDLGALMFRRADYSKSLEYYEQSLAAYRKLFPTSKYPDGHPQLATCLTNLGLLQQTRGEFESSHQFHEQALAMRRKLYPQTTHPDGHSELINGLNNLGALYQAEGAYEKAQPYYEQSLEMARKLFPESKYPAGHVQVAYGLNNLANLFESQNAYEQARPLYEQAIAMFRKLYPEAKYPAGHPELAQALNNLGSLLQAQGAFSQARVYYQQALAMRQKLFPESRFPNGHPALSQSTRNQAYLLTDEGNFEEARIIDEKCLAMNRRLYPEARYPNGHPDLANSLNSIGFLYQAQGAFEQARTYYEQAVAMYRKLYPESRYPDGHPRLANSVNNLAFTLQSLHAYDQAQARYEEGLSMRRKLFPRTKYPDGHLELAQSLGTMGLFLDLRGDDARAQDFYEQALAMRRRLYPPAKYPDGHPSIALNLNNLGAVLRDRGRLTDAASHYEQSLAMYRKLYPETRYPIGHPELALSLNNIGYFCLAKGDVTQARSYFIQAQAMRSRLMRQTLLAASEAESLSYLAAQPLTRDGLLSATESQPGTADETYRAIWNDKAVITRVMELRQATSRRADSADQVTRLREIRRRIDQLLQDTRLKPDLRDRTLAGYADERDRLERDLAQAIPIMAQWDRVDRIAPADLAATLPDGAVFLDLIAYMRSDPNAPVKSKDATNRVPCYVAFVVARGQSVRRIELGPAAPIDAAIRSWRIAVQEGGIDDGSALRTSVWEPIAKQLPNGTRTLYLSPDGDLARLPWAALPVGASRVLLEDVAIATVPYGSFLLDKLKAPKTEPQQKLLVMGGLDYASSVWPELPGTRIEVDALVALAPSTVALTGAEASGERLTVALKTASLAHLATHGEFKSAAFVSERKRDQEARDRLKEDTGPSTRRVATRNPLGYVGLVLANGEVMSGLSILNLDLENLKLVTLSACETGLGEFTGGKGVENLQLAFHLAGCPNVIASLWKVNDAATAALMTKFYHELWVNRKPPIEALREAQLIIYRHPELVPDLAGVRGAPKLKDAVSVRSTDPMPSANRKRAGTRLWAGFVLSGAGR